MMLENRYNLRDGEQFCGVLGDGKPVEQYVYDPAGNILSKTVNSKTTTFTYDKANQLASSTVDGKTIDYRYDGAGRLVQEGDKTYQYGYLDKILNVLENGEAIAGFDYHMNGQIASSTTKDGTENFLWDGLALIHRGGTNYINEPAVTGGNPILADGNVLFNDMLGTTLGVKSGESFDSITRDAFGQTADQSKDQFFTGKPYVGELGYAFLFRNYRADQGKWQTRDPLGYPDGWNSLTYVNNGVTSAVDWLGGWTYTLIDSPSSPGGYLSSFNLSETDRVTVSGEMNCTAGGTIISASIDLSFIESFYNIYTEEMDWTSAQAPEEGESTALSISLDVTTGQGFSPEAVSREGNRAIPVIVSTDPLSYLSIIPVITYDMVVSISETTPHDGVYYLTASVAFIFTYTAPVATGYAAPSHLRVLSATWEVRE